MSTQLRVVIDTNVMLRAAANPTAASGMLVTACERRRIILLLSRRVLAEYLAVLHDPEVTGRHPAITRSTVDNILKRLRYVADRYRSTPRFRFPRDPRDEPFLELAIAGSATHIITSDQDLLSLPTAKTDAGKRFRQQLPRTLVLQPGDFIHMFPHLFSD